MLLRVEESLFEQSYKVGLVVGVFVGVWVVIRFMFKPSRELRALIEEVLQDGEPVTLSQIQKRIDRTGKVDRLVVLWCMGILILQRRVERAQAPGVTSVLRKLEPCYRRQGSANT